MIYLLKRSGSHDACHGSIITIGGRTNVRRNPMPKPQAPNSRAGWRTAIFYYETRQQAWIRELENAANPNRSNFTFCSGGREGETGGQRRFCTSLRRGKAWSVLDEDVTEQGYFSLVAASASEEIAAKIYVTIVVKCFFLCYQACIQAVEK